jgi:putative Flp pilus-assembly TadE/G-like protein
MPVQEIFSARRAGGAAGRRLADETGMSMVFVSVGFMAFFAATTLAIDVGLFMTARTQAQNSADAAALAGATAFVYNDFDDRSPGGPAVQSALSAAKINKVVGGDVAIEPADVTFPIGSGGQYDRVQVWVRKNSIPTLIGDIFNVGTFDIAATATAEAAPANAMTCVKPFTIPDKWEEHQDPKWTIDSTFHRYDKKGAVIPNADVYIPPSATHKTWTEDDAGTYFVLRAGTGNNIFPTMYYSWKMPGDIGGDFYRDNIAKCNTTTIGLNKQMVQEPGAMEGPTISGLKDLYAQDPYAYWDRNAKRVVSDKGQSPRVFPIPLYDPDMYENGKMNGRDATLFSRNWLGFFLEGFNGNEAYGRIVPITGVIDQSLPMAPDGVYPRAIRLVK